jgi:hypothetical protein
MAIGDGLTQDAQVVGHAFHLTTVVTDAKVALLEDMKLGINLQDARLVVTKELGLHSKPRLSSGLQWLTDDLVKLDEESAQDPSQHNVVQPDPIGGHVDAVGEDVTIEGIAAECEEHEVEPPLVVG